MDIEDLAQRQRLESAAKAKRLAQRRDEVAFWDGSAATLGDQIALPTSVSSNGPLRSGQSVHLQRSGGINQADTFSRTEQFESVPVRILTGDVWVLAKRTLPSGKVQLLLGGKIRTAILVVDDLPANVDTYLDLTSADDWIVSYKAFLPTGNLYSVGSISGNLSTINNKWEIQSLVAAYLTHYGYGFFASSQLYGISIGRFASFDSTSLPNSSTTPPGLGTYFKGGYHHERTGFSTVAPEYYETRYISGSTSASVSGHDYRTGIVQPFIDSNFPVQITGTNEYRYDATQIQTFVGEAQGPGYLGEALEECSIVGEVANSGIELRPKKVTNFNSSFSSNYSANTVSFSAYAGALSINQGASRFNEGSSYQYSEDIFYDNILKRIEYRRFCNAYDNGNFYKIGGFNEVLWDNSGIQSSNNYQGLSASLSHDFILAPGVSKPIAYTASRTAANSNIFGNSTVYNPSITLSNGYSYKKVDSSGSAQFSSQNNGPFPTWQSINSRLLLNFNGQEIELSQALNSNITYTSQNSSPYPVGYSVTPIFVPGSASKRDFKTGVEFNVSISTGYVVNSKLFFSSTNDTKKHKSLPMKISSTADYSDVNVVAYKYWPKN